MWWITQLGATTVEQGCADERPWGWEKKEKNFRYLQGIVAWRHLLGTLWAVTTKKESIKNGRHPTGFVSLVQGGGAGGGGIPLFYELPRRRSR